MKTSHLEIVTNATCSRCGGSPAEDRSCPDDSLLERLSGLARKMFVLNGEVICELCLEAAR